MAPIPTPLSDPDEMVTVEQDEPLETRWEKKKSESEALVQTYHNKVRGVSALKR